MSSSSDPLQNSFDSYEPKQELESPFLNEEYLADEARIAQWRIPMPGVQLESPFLEAFENGWRSGEVEEFEEFLHESDEEEKIVYQANRKEAEFLDNMGEPLREDEIEIELPKNSGDLYSHVHKHELEQGKYLVELKEAEGLESYQEDLDWLTENLDKEVIEGETPQEQVIKGLINKGLSENVITNKVFWQRNPNLVGQKVLQAKNRQQWMSILRTEVRPSVKRLLVLNMVDPLHLAIFFSQYESVSVIPDYITEQFLTRAPLLSMGKTLRDQILWNWKSGNSPITRDLLYKLAYDVSGHAGSAMLLCHNVTKAFAKGSVAITWDRDPKKPATYSNGEKTWIPKVIHRDGKLIQKKSDKYKLTLPVIFYLLFSTKDFGTNDYGDWYHYYLAATMTAYGAAGELKLRTIFPCTLVRKVQEYEDRTTGWIGGSFYPAIVSDRIRALECEIIDPDLIDTPGYRGWVLSNIMSFLEGGHYGINQEDVARESRFHILGAAAGLRTTGIEPGKNWLWYVPKALSISKDELFGGFTLQDKTYEMLNTSGQAYKGTK
jgi:hypothetical protein